MLNIRTIYALKDTINAQKQKKSQEVKIRNTSGPSSVRFSVVMSVTSDMTAAGAASSLPVSVYCGHPSMTELYYYLVYLGLKPM